MQLPDAAIDQDQTGHLFLFFLQALVAARDHLPHGREIVYSFDRADDEFAVVGFLHAAGFPYDHGRDSLCPLNVRDVEALDALRAFGQAQGFLQGFLDGACVGLHYAEALIVGLLGVVAGEIDQGALLAS